MNDLNDLPLLPFEQILSYLSLEDRIRSRAVSRSWCMRIDSFKKPTNLFYSSRQYGFIYEKSDWSAGHSSRTLSARPDLAHSSTHLASRF